MSAYKQFLSTDVIVAPLVVNKSFSFEGTASLNNNRILRFIGENIPYNPYSDSYIDLYQSQSSALIYNSIKQLYYTNYISNPISGSPYITNYLNQVVEDDSRTNVYSRFYNYESTTFFQTNSLGYTSNYGYDRYFPTSSYYPISVLSIPKNLFGDYINPNTFYLRVYSVNDAGYITITDNGEGILQFSGNLNPLSGIISYQHGLISFNQLWDDPYSDWIIGTHNEFTCSFQSSRTIYETQYKCTIRPEEFTFSLNPSLISSSTNGTVYNFVTSSYFSPYVTTVGFYNEAQELLMVAKLGQPLPTSTTTDTTILVNIDK